MMSTVPPILLQKLAALRRREKLLRLAWGATRVAALALAVLMLACFIDWLVDLWDETPFELRVGLLVGQLALAALLAALLIALPLLRRLRDDALALYVEDRCPRLQHRLISALQLNRPGARTQGMSGDLLEAMTREAVAQVRPLSLAALADHRRLARGALVFAPVVLVALALALLFPDVVSALLRRQLLDDVEIPRRVQIENATAPIWPSGEEVVLRFHATGPDLDAGTTGTVRVRPDGQASFTVPLTFEAHENGHAVFAARLQPATVNFHFSARLGDGRTRKPNRIEYVSRPSVEQQDSSLVLPEYLGLRSNGTPFEEFQPGGDIKGMPDLSVHIMARTQKPIRRAILQTYGSPYPDLSHGSGFTKTHEGQAAVASTLSALALCATPNAGPLAAVTSAVAGQANVPLRQLTLRRFAPDAQEARWHLDLRPTETSYSIVVFDEYLFASKTKTLRALKIEPEPPPVVTLHPHWQAGDSKSAYVDFESLPLPIIKGEASPVLIAYDAFGPYGIGKVQLKIGVFRGRDNSGERLRRGILELWGTLELEEVVLPPRRPREFELDAGAFKDSAAKEQISFFAVPVRRAFRDLHWPRQLAGGRFVYKVAGFVDVRTGLPFEFAPEDRIVLYLEVFNRNPDPAKALAARSARAIEKELTTRENFYRIADEALGEVSRIEALMYMQQQVYDRPWLSIFGFK
jgi:hypothetical protein